MVALWVWDNVYCLIVSEYFRLIISLYIEICRQLSRQKFFSELAKTFYKIKEAMYTLFKYFIQKNLSKIVQLGLWFFLIHLSIDLFAFSRYEFQNPNIILEQTFVVNIH